MGITSNEHLLNLIKLRAEDGYVVVKDIVIAVDEPCVDGVEVWGYNGSVMPNSRWRMSGMGWINVRYSKFVDSDIQPPPKDIAKLVKFAMLRDRLDKVKALLNDVRIAKCDSSPICFIDSASDWLPIIRLYEDISWVEQGWEGPLITYRGSAEGAVGMIPRNVQVKTLEDYLASLGVGSVEWPTPEITPADEMTVQLPDFVSIHPDDVKRVTDLLAELRAI